MVEVVSGWHDNDTVYLLERKEDDKFKLHKHYAQWSFFLKGADENDCQAIKEVDGRIVPFFDKASDYVRFDCGNRWARKDMVELLSNNDINVLEGDVSPLTRFLSDKNCQYEIAKNFKIGFFDLETDSRVKFERAIEGKAAILSWALCDAQGNHWEDIVDEKDPFASFEEMEVDPESEKKILLRFLKLAEQFDVLMAWNGDGFDFPVIQERCKSLGINVVWKQWNFLDSLEVYKKYNVANEGSGEQKQSFKLEHVAQYLLGEGKHDFDSSKTWEAWAKGSESRQKLLDYNVQDTALLPRIEEKSGYIQLHFVVCQICNLFPNSWSLNATIQGDGFLLKLGDEFDYRFPTRHYTDIPEKFKGAYVMKPLKLGAIDNVHVADFAGLYPSIMRTWNMSLDTKLKEPNETCCKLPDRETYFETTRRGIVPMALDRLVAQRAEYQKLLAQAQPGSKEWVKYKQLSSAFKIVANSFYGIVGSAFSRFFDKDVAEGVTQTGKWLLLEVIEESKRQGLEPLYGDSDSAFVSGDAEKFQEVVDYLNNSWTERLKEFGVYGKHHIKLEFEKSFNRLIILAKKRYAASLAGYKGKEATDDAREIKGLEYRRGDTIILAREFQKEIIDSLLAPDLPSPNNVWEIVKKHHKKILNGELTLEQVTLSKGLQRAPNTYGVNYTKETCATTYSRKVETGEFFKNGKPKTRTIKRKCEYDFGGKHPMTSPVCPECGAERNKSTPPAHVRVANKMIEAGEHVEESDKVFYIIAKPDDPKDKKANPYPAHWDNALQKVDRQYYWTKLIYPPTLRILEVVYPEEPWSDILK